MEISDIVTQDITTHDPDAPASTLVGIFDDPAVKGIVIEGDVYQGVITRRQLVTSHLQPNQKLRTLARNVPRLAPNEDVRKVARLMLDSDAQILPVFEGRRLRGVVDVDGILETVQPFLDAATVEDVYTRDLRTLQPDDTVGAAIHGFREHRVTHLPVIEDADPVGILSVFDVLDFRVREEMRSQGGGPGGQHAFGDSSGTSGRGGFGAREGESTRMLDLPVRDLMSSPVATIDPEDTLDVAVERMFEIGGSSLLVAEDGRPYGIVTKTDVLDALTWEAEGNRAVQIYGIDLLDDMTQEEVLEMFERFDDRDTGMSVLDAKVHLHEHDERRRGRRLLMARVRVFTDRGLFLASGEGFGARQAINEARDAVERQLEDRKTHGQSKKPRSEEYWEKRFGWVLEELE